MGRHLFEELAGLPVDVEYASEYIYRTLHTPSARCVLVLSQSGETADTLEALREARMRDAATIAITNVEGSTMARLADCSLTTRAGVEKAVPATKSFTTQLLMLHLLALFTARARGTDDECGGPGKDRGAGRDAGEDQRGADRLAAYGGGGGSRDAACGDVSLFGAGDPFSDCEGGCTEVEGVGVCAC